MLRTLLIVFVTSLLVPAAAHAGTPFTIGEGGAPHVLTEEVSGTAHVVWSNALEDSIHYCQVPRGTTTCTKSRTLGAGGVEEGNVYLLRSSATDLDIIVPIYGSSDILAYRSVDNGENFMGPTQLYNPSAPQLGSYDTEPVLGPEAGHVTIGSSNADNRIHSALLNSSEGGMGAGQTLSSSFIYDFQVARVGAAGLIGVGNDLTGTKVWRMQSSNPNTSLYFVSDVSSDLDDTKLASRNGVAWLSGVARPGGGSDRVEIRKWTGGAFDAPRVIANERADFTDVDVAPTGAVAAIWRHDVSGSGSRLRLALSGDGTTFGVSSIASEDTTMADMDVSLAGDNAGWATYEGVGGGATRQIRLVDTTPVTEPTPPATTPIAAPAPAPGPTPKPLPKPVTPKKTKSVKVSSNGANITLGVPNQCIPSGKPFTATLTWKKQKRKGNRFVKISRTDFYVGKKRLKIDRKAPFRQTMTIPKPKKGASYTFKARAFIKMSKGKRIPKKSITAKLKVCA